MLQSSYITPDKLKKRPVLEKKISAFRNVSRSKVKSSGDVFLTSGDPGSPNGFPMLSEARRSIKTFKSEIELGGSFKNILLGGQDQEQDYFIDVPATYDQNLIIQHGNSEPSELFDRFESMFLQRVNE